MSGACTLEQGSSLLLGFPAEDFPALLSFIGKQEYPEKQVLLKFKTIFQSPCI